MIPGDDNRLAVRGQLSQQVGGFQCRSLIMHEVAEDNQAPRFVFTDQLQQPLRDRGHPPHWDETTRRALAELVAEMQVRYGEPAFRLVEKREPAIEEDFIGDEGLIGT
jgi:hypothetical protein